MKKIVALVCVAAGLCAFGAPTMGEDDGKYVIDVPAGETYALTADDVAAIGTLPLGREVEGRGDRGWEVACPPRHQWTGIHD